MPPALPWIMWGLGALFYCYGFFQRTSPSVMVDELMREFAVGATLAGTLSGLYFYTYAGLQIPVGLILDRFGPRRVLAVSCALAGAGSALFALADSLMMAYAGRLMIGGAVAFTWVGALLIISRWFPSGRFAMISGLTLALGMAGGVGGQAPLALLIAEVGWRGALGIAAALALVLAALIALVVRDHGPFLARPDPATPEAPRKGLVAGLARVLRNPQTYTVGLYGAALTSPMLAFAGLWGVPYLERLHGVEREVAALATSAMMIGWAIGAPLMGWLSDRLRRRRRVMLLASSGSLLTLAAALYAPGLPFEAVAVLLVANGVFGGGMVLCFAAGREHNPAWAAGAALGVVNMLAMSSGAIFQPLLGWLLDQGWDGVMEAGRRVYSAAAFQDAVWVLVLMQGVAVTAALLTRETHGRPRAEDT
ncbi:MFS transporter [Roseospira visakhapatnamensis]|uniref:Lysosomal dipeptide transporter MFSD1 n=1 Tax=Roseospira visakhapatnamensis TaxID=390880 RepID=A0A7W6RFM6_9PROT|nr:MFS family permease [Roseospira visakhapatnamensis]